METVATSSVIVSHAGVQPAWGILEDESIIAYRAETQPNPSSERQSEDFLGETDLLESSTDPQQNQLGNSSHDLFSKDPNSVDWDPEGSNSKAIVFFRKGDDGCDPHQFASGVSSEDFLGSGAYGDVFKVDCKLCRKKFACKIIRCHKSINKAARAKHIQAMDMELRCYMTLDHPHIIKYVHHELTEMKMTIFTEYCQLKDLETLLEETPEVGLDSTMSWVFLEGLASAMARCHYGLQASKDESEILCDYVDFEDGWEPILHRDIKPGNVLLAWRGEPPTLVLKLGDFGTSFKLEDGGKPPSTQRAGTRVYWAPEIADEERSRQGRITRWSAMSDIWGVGAVMHKILVGQIPSHDQENNNKGRLRYSQSSTARHDEFVPELLSRVICECLNRKPEMRPTSLQLLSVAVKSDTSPRGLRRSASFWKAISKHSLTEIASSVTRHFVSKYLPLLATEMILFSPREIPIIMSLVKLYCAEFLSVCSRQLCAGFGGNLAGSTVFHALACVPADEQDIVQFAMDESKWPLAKEISHMALKKNDLGLLPSACAAGKGNITLCALLTELEDQIRFESAERAQRNALNIHQTRFEAAAENEFNFMFKLLTRGRSSEFRLPVTQAARALIETAQLGYSNVVQKLIELGVSPSVQGRRQETALHIFSYAGNKAMIRYLLEHGVDVNARDRNSTTPLHWAAWAGKYEATQELLMHSADVNAVDRDGRTALFGAAGGGFADVVKLLLQRKADKLLRGGAKLESPLDRAMRRKHELVVVLLQEKQDATI